MEAGNRLKACLRISQISHYEQHDKIRSIGVYTVSLFISMLYVPNSSTVCCTDNVKYFISKSFSLIFIFIKCFLYPLKAKVPRYAGMHFYLTFGQFSVLTASVLLINISLSLYLAFQPICTFSLLNLSRCLVLLAPVVCPSVALPCCSTRSKRCMSRHTKRKSRGRIRETWTADPPSTPAAPPY